MTLSPPALPGTLFGTSASLAHRCAVSFACARDFVYGGCENFAQNANALDGTGDCSEYNRWS